VFGLPKAVCLMNLHVSVGRTWNGGGPGSGLPTGLGDLVWIDTGMSMVKPMNLDADPNPCYNG